MESERNRWTELVLHAGLVSADVVELSALSAHELPRLATFLADHPTLNFSYVSVHGPAKGWPHSPDLLARQLDETIPSYVTGIVMHPETLGDPSAFNLLKQRLLLENMDGLKSDARTADELIPYFDVLPDAGFCFDIAHAYMNDHSMTLAHELLDAYGERLREVHLSSILADGTHVTLRVDDVERFSPILERCRDVPWILESEPPSR